MEKYSNGNVSATIHFAASYCVLGETKRTALDYGTASLDIEREKICLDSESYLTRLKLTNTSGTMLKLLSVYPIMTDDLTIGDIPSVNWQILNGSRQLNDVPATCFLGIRDASFEEASDRLQDEGICKRNAADGDAVFYGDGITIIKAGNTYVSLEILTGEHQLTDISISADYKGNLKAIRLGGEFGCLMNDGDVLYTEWVRITQGGNFVRLLEEYAMERKAMSYAGDIKKSASVYRVDKDLSAEDVSRLISILSSLKAPFDYIELGDGWYNYIGDWSDSSVINTSYVAGIINKTAFKAGIWTTPFLADRNSEVYANEKKWFLRHADGSLCTYEIKGREYAVFDISSEEVLDHLCCEYKRLAAQGFYFHHVDNTNAFLIQKDVILANPRLSMAKAYKNAMRMISSSIGDEGYLYVTDGFMPLLCGIADSVQISSDTNVMMKKSGAMNVLPKLVNQCALRAHTSEWWNCVTGSDMCEDFEIKFSSGEKRNLLLCEYIASSPSVITGTVSNDRLKQLRYTYPQIPKSVYPRDAFCDKAYMDIVDVEINNSYHTLCIFNNSFSEAEITFRLDSGICGGYVDRASEYNISAYFNHKVQYDLKCGSIIKLGTIPPNSCEIVKIVKNDKPHILNSDMHFSMGGEVTVYMEADYVIVEGNNLFNYRGNYCVCLPKEYQCMDGKREFSFAVNGEGKFTYRKQIRRR